MSENTHDKKTEISDGEVASEQMIHAFGNAIQSVMVGPLRHVHATGNEVVSVLLSLAVQYAKHLNVDFASVATCMIAAVQPDRVKAMSQLGMAYAAKQQIKSL